MALSVTQDNENAVSGTCGQIRAALKMRGALIGPNDTLISAHARCLGLTLVTNNVREFGRVPRLKVENWTE